MLHRLTIAELTARLARREVSAEARRLRARIGEMTADGTLLDPWPRLGSSTLYALAVTKQGSGSGTVTSSPAGILCGAACLASYVHGTVVTLTATPAAGSVFAGWTGACTGTGACWLSAGTWPVFVIVCH